jgi:hypothetical protein
MPNDQVSRLLESDFDRALRVATQGADAPPALSYTERVRAAAAHVTTLPFAVAVRTDAVRLVVNGREWYAARQQILRDPNLNQQGRVRVLDGHDGRYDAALAQDLGRFVEHFTRGEGLVLNTPPVFAPRDTTDALRVNGIMADVESYDVETLERVAREAIARTDLFLLDRLVRKAGAVATWKKPFSSSAEVLIILDAMRAALATPEVVRSEAVRQWLASARTDVRYLVNELRKGHGKLDPVNITTGALVTLFPDRVVPGAE